MGIISKRTKNDLMRTIKEMRQTHDELMTYINGMDCEEDSIADLYILCYEFETEIRELADIANSL